MFLIEFNIKIIFLVYVQTGDNCNTCLFYIYTVVVKLYVLDKPEITIQKKCCVHVRNYTISVSTTRVS